MSATLRACDIDVDGSHDISSEHDLIKLLEADIGIAIVPCSASMPDTLRRAPIEGLDVRRTVQLFGVAGRERTAVASAVDENAAQRRLAAIHRPGDGAREGNKTRAFDRGRLTDTGGKNQWPKKPSPNCLKRPPRTAG